jgi:hypothetical protein
MIGLPLTVGAGAKSSGTTTVMVSVATTFTGTKCGAAISNEAMHRHANSAKPVRLNIVLFILSPFLKKNRSLIA